MKVTFYGTRGSTPVAAPNKVKYGGNTTCVRIDSSCLPEGQWLLVDAGTGIVPLAGDFFKAQGKAVTILQTHSHHDHTQGLALSPFPYMKGMPLTVYGPVEREKGPRQVYQALMQPPFFPVDLKEVGSHVSFRDIVHPNGAILVIHPEGGRKVFTVEQFETLANDGRQMPFRSGRKFDLAECLVVRMHKSNHPEQTISYRFEERPTGLVFVFVTDHENQDGVPTSFKAHLTGAHLLVMDTQYTREKYDAMTAGWGHGTPDYTSRVAKVVGASALGMTHHDPASSDGLIDEIVATGQGLLQEAGCNIPVFGCRDYLTVDVGNVAESIN